MNLFRTHGNTHERADLEDGAAEHGSKATLQRHTTPQRLDEWTSDVATRHMRGELVLAG
jgi:hypothetical protein